jgi:hypothetical protein
MKRSKREAAKASAENLKAQRQADKIREYQDRERKARIVQDKIAKSNKESKFSSSAFNPFLRAVEKKAPKLLGYTAALTRLEQSAHIRDISDWKPKGKGRETLFTSLASHLLAKYYTPKFLWSAF